MKKILLIIMSLAMLTLILGGCSDVVSGKPDTGHAGTEINIPQGFGALRVNVTLGNARTALPTVPALSYKYIFSKKDKITGDWESGVSKSPAHDGTFILELGTYRLRIEAYIDDEDEIVAEGQVDGDIVIAGGDPITASVTLHPIIETGTGTLSFKITHNGTGTVSVTAFTLTNLFDDDEIIDLYEQYHWADSQPSLSESHTASDIPAGYYLLQIKLKKGNKYASKSEVVHIYGNLTTETAYTFEDTDFVSDLFVTNTSDDANVEGSLRYAVENAGNGRTIRITLPDNDSVIRLESSLEIKNNKSITIESNNDVIITRANDTFTKPLFTIGESSSSGKLTLSGEGSSGTITLDGGNKNSITAEAALITVTKGELVMNDGVTLRNNGNSSGNGGGVYVGTFGTFTMNGGTISGNAAQAIGSNAAYGGGVYVDYGGIFNMESGTIGGNEITTTSGNGYGGGVYTGGTFNMDYGTIRDNKIILNNMTSSGSGGGVYVGDDGTFNMIGGGIISNNTITGSNSNNSGGGVGVGGSSSFFTMSGGEIKGNKITNGTISNGKGGGVYVGNTSTFQMTDGIVNGNEVANDDDKNNAATGAALYVNDGTAQYGTVKPDGEWDITNGSLATTNDTIRVVEGVLTVTSAGEWAGAVTHVSSGSGTDYLINIDGNVNVGGSTAATFTASATKNVTIRGGGTLQLTSEGCLLYISSNQTVIIQDIKLVGYGGGDTYNPDDPNNNTDSLVFIYKGGDFTMKGSASVSGNTNGSGTGGGVFVDTNSKFTMQDSASIFGNIANKAGGGVYVHEGSFFMQGNASIYDNTSYGVGGGGVYIEKDGIFTMQDDATVSRNHQMSADENGGGVYVNMNGVFHMAGGTIYGEDGGSNANTVINGNEGAALFVNNDGSETGTAEYGTFDGDNWEKKGDLATTDNTVRVVGGVPQSTP